MSNRPSSSKAQSTSKRVAHARGADQSSTRWWIIVGVVVVVLVALIVAISVTRTQEAATVASGVPSAGFNTSEGAAPDLITAPVKVEGTPLPALPSPSSTDPSPADPAVGQTVPQVSGQKFNGDPITIPVAGRPKVVLFVAHWCPHCQKEVPLITEHLGGRLPADVDLYAVSTAVAEPKGNYPPGAWLRKENWPIPTLVDDAQGTAADAYGLSGFPFFTAVDKDGKVVERQSGEISMEQFDALIAAAAKGSPAPAP
jgi:cytochrome c biogenesis protein CcmG/thiol:disulfide interchange protein DsbE